MADGKKSFVLYCDLIYTVDLLEDDLAGKLFKHLLRYVNDENPETADILLKVAFEPIKRQLKRDLKDWEQSLTKRSDAGVLGNLKRWHLDIYEQVMSGKITLEQAIETTKHRKISHTDNMQSPTIPIVANIADTVTVNVNDTVTVSDTVKNKSYQRTKFPIIPKAEKKNENMVVIEMVKIFKAKKKAYIVDEGIDYPACLQIAYHIAKLKGWKKIDIVGDKETDVLLSWKKIVDFLVSDKWFTTRTLSDIAGKEWNRIEPSMKSLKNGTPKKDTSGGYNTGIKDSSIYDKMK